MFYGPPGQYMWKSLESLSLSIYIYMFGLSSPNGPHFVPVSFSMHKRVDKKIS
jgi:hypothetical protein